MSSSGMLTRRITHYVKDMHFTRPFWIMATGSFINRAGNFVMPFFALYLTSRQHLSISEATLIISAMGIGSLVAGICGGVLADTIGRRTTILLSLICSATFMLALGFSHSVPLIILFAILFEFSGDLYRPASSAAIADIVPAAKRPQAYSIRYWANNIGSAIGPVIAGLLAPISYLLLFIGDALTTLIFSVMVWLGFPEPQRVHKTVANKEHAGIRDAFKDPWLWSYALLGFLFDCLYIQWGTSLPIDMSAHGLKEVAYGSIMSINALQVVLISLPITSFFARRAHHIALACAALMLGVGMGIHGLLHSYPGYVLAVCIWTFGEIINYPISSSVIVELSPAHLRGTYQGIFSTIRSCSFLIAPAVGGFFLEHFGSFVLWSGCLIIGLCIATGYLVLGKLHRRFRPQPVSSL